jgi:hypothetical protein
MFDIIFFIFVAFLINSLVICLVCFPSRCCCACLCSKSSRVSLLQLHYIVFNLDLS